MSSHVTFDNEATQKLLTGVDTVANAVKVTLGAKGRNVIISRSGGYLPIITKDGVTVANYITRLADPIEDMGAMMVKDAARQTMRLVGDGTTTSTVLAQAIFRYGLEFIATGTNPMDMKRGIDKGVEAAIKAINSISIPIDGSADSLRHVATIAANNDEPTGRIISDAVIAAGRDGHVSIYESKNAETIIEKVRGMQIDRGYMDPIYCNNKEKMQAELRDVDILIYDKKISSFKDIEPLLASYVNSKKGLLIIAEDIDGEAQFTIRSNVHKFGYPWATIQSPFGGIEELEDIATVTGAIVVSESKGYTLRTVPAKALGHAESVVISKFGTLITYGAGKKEDVAKRVKQINIQIEDCPDDRMKANLVKRLSRVSDGVVVVYVGGQTEVEMKEKKDRIDDGVRATKAAMGGVVVGGGIAHLYASKKLTDYIDFDTLSTGEIAGVDVVQSALRAPFRQILSNAGLQNEDVETKLDIANGYGYNVRTGTIEKFYDTGVIDPTMVSRVTLENAASVASMLLTTACAITDVPDTK